MRRGVRSEGLRKEKIRGVSDSTSFAVQDVAPNSRAKQLRMICLAISHSLFVHGRLGTHPFPRDVIVRVAGLATRAGGFRLTASAALRCRAWSRRLSRPDP
jgi:hypothetical protein